MTKCFKYAFNKSPQILVIPNFYCDIIGIITIDITLMITKITSHGVDLILSIYMSMVVHNILWLILISCGHPKVLFFYLLWWASLIGQAQKKVNQALDSPKIDML